MQNDYISREALVKELMDRDFYPAIVRRAIESISPADVRPVVHGRWIDNMKCSECWQVDWTKPPYCPNCWAMMDGGSNNA